MAWEKGVLDLSFVAAEDLSDYQYHFVVLGSTEGQVRLPDSASEKAIGILQNAPESGEAAAVRVIGVSKLVVNDALTVGLPVALEYVGAADAGKGLDASSVLEYTRALCLGATDAEDDLATVLLIDPSPMDFADLTIPAESVTLAKLADLAQGSLISGQASDRPLALDAKGDGKILVGDGTDVNSVAVSGDVTLDNAGAVTIADNAVNTDKLKYKSVAVTIGAGTASGSSANDAELVGGAAVGVVPAASNAPDQHVQSVAIDGSGAVTVTLAGNSTSEVVYNVTCLRAAA